MDSNALYALPLRYSAEAAYEPVATAVSYNAGHIVLSFFTSLSGCITTIELLQRRTSTRGIYNWFLLITSAITMGGIGIWAMHFVGNRAIVMDFGNPQRQILYNPGFTALSFFVPILVLPFAFYLLGLPIRPRQSHLVIAAFLTGVAVCGMHYLGQMGIENYHCVYRLANVVGAVIIAVLASYISLTVFFILRDGWTDSWWKRGLCAVILALAVSGMHWTAASGTQYQWKRNLAIHGNSRSQTAIIASSLSMVACLGLLAVAFIRGRNRRSARIKSQRLVLACAYFDKNGNLMVTQECILPSTKITNYYVEKTFGEDELSRSHETFLWIFKASRNWAVLRDLVSGMKANVETDLGANRHDRNSKLSNTSEESSNFAPIFKQLFCVAAQQLAQVIHEPLERIGVLFEEPLETGAVCVSTESKTCLRRLSLCPPAGRVNVECGYPSHAIPRGKYLFILRQVNKSEAAKFASLGYRFAAVDQVADQLARSMQVDREYLLARMERMKLSALSGNLPLPGVHLSCFMLRPSMGKSFDILVPAHTQNQLPHVTLQLEDLSKAQSKQLQLLDESSISQVLAILHDPSGRSGFDDPFRLQLYSAFAQLIDVVGDSDTMMQAKFSAREFHIPCQTGRPSGSRLTCTLLTVRALRNIHASSTCENLTYIPLSFFSAQQQTQAGHADDELFARSVRLQFGHLRSESIEQHTPGSRLQDRTPSLAESNTQGPESPRPVLFRYLGRRSIPDRGSDDATIVDSEKAFGDAADLEMTPLPSRETGGSWDRRMYRAESVASEGGHWVGEVFDLFRLREDGWRAAKRGGWHWDIGIKTSFEVRTKDPSNE